MDNNNSAFPMFISVVVTSPQQLAGVYAFLGGTAALTVGSPPVGNVERAPAKQDTMQFSANTGLQESGASAGTGESATTGASPSDENELDAHGHPWSADLHASTRGKTKDGLWRMKVGVQRPDPLPGFPVEEPGTGTSQATSTPSATLPPATGQASGQAATAEEEDEFATFRAASDASNKQDEAAKASVPPRKFTDADLGALCNQAAVKLGDPSPIKEIIARFVPEGQVAHSRNIPEDQRDNFAKEVEAKAGIEFAG